MKSGTVTVGVRAQDINEDRLRIIELERGLDCYGWLL